MQHPCAERTLGRGLLGPLTFTAVAGLAVLVATSNSRGGVTSPQGGADPLAYVAALLGPAYGTLEPCGCAGGMLGGIDRVATATSMHRRSRQAPGLAIAAGGVVSKEAADSGVGPWMTAQVEALYLSYGLMALDGVAVNSMDLSAGPLALQEAARAFLGETPLFATNLVAADGTAPLPREVRRGDVQVLAFLPPGLSFASEPGSETFWRTIAADAALAALGPRPEGVRRIALIEGGEAEAKALAVHFGPSDVLAWHGGLEDASPAAQPLLGPGGPVGGFLGARGRHVIGLRAGPGAVGWERHPVEAALPADPLLVPSREIYRELLAGSDVVGLVAGSKGAHPRGAFAGSASCQACHADAHAIWDEGLHGRALEALAKDLRGAMNALVDPACVRCHAVGYGYEGGFGSATAPGGADRSIHALLAGVGCESCHGPAAEHVRTGLKEHVERSNQATCMVCHDADNDPNFDFGRKWPLVEHNNP